MRSIYSAVIAALFSLLLTACASNPEIPFDRSAAAPIKTIGILTPAFPSGPSVVLASSVGQSFGLVGALVDAGLQARRDSQFSGLLKQQSFVVPSAFQSNLEAELKAQGYILKPIQINRDGTDFLKEYPSSKGVDAYLDIAVIMYGYIASGIGSSTPYRPALTLKCKLVSVSDHSVLMQNSIIYNPINQPRDAVTIAPDPKFAFVDFDALMATPPQAVANLGAATKASAHSLAALLR